MPIIETRMGLVRRARRTNTTGSFPTVPMTVNGLANRRTGSGNAVANTTLAVIDLMDLSELARPSGIVPNSVKVWLYGAGVDNNQPKIRLYAWNLLIEDGDLSTAQLVQCLLCELTGTISATPKGAGLPGLLLATDLFCDTLALTGTSGNNGINIDIFSPADDASSAHAIVPLKGAAQLEVALDKGTATNANALLQLIY